MVSVFLAQADLQRGATERCSRSRARYGAHDVCERLHGDMPAVLRSDAWISCIAANAKAWVNRTAVNDAARKPRPVRQRSRSESRWLRPVHKRSSKGSDVAQRRGDLSEILCARRGFHASRRVNRSPYRTANWFIAPSNRRSVARFSASTLRSASHSSLMAASSLGKCRGS